MADLTETKIRSIVREELREQKIYDLPVQVSQLDGKIEKQVSQLDGKIEKRVAQINGRIDKLESKVDGIQKQNNRIFWGMFSFFIAILVAIFGTFGVVIQILME